MHCLNWLASRTDFDDMICTFILNLSTFQSNYNVSVYDFFAEMILLQNLKLWHMLVVADVLSSASETDSELSDADSERYSDDSYENEQHNQLEETTE